MRKSVLAGLFVCAIFFGTTSKSSAFELESIQTKPEANKAVLLASATVKDPLVIKEKDQKAEEKQDKQQKVHKIAEKETLSTIAKKYETTWKKVYDKNENIKNPDIINPGEEIVIPEKDEDVPPRDLPEIEVEPSPTTTMHKSKAVSAQTSSPHTVVSRGSSSGNRYVAGYCTWHAKNMRPDLPNNLGNAISWVSRASAQGIPTGSTPRTGAIAQRGNHVGYVQSVNSDGTFVISDMNHRRLYEVTVRTVPSSGWMFVY